MPVTSFFSAVSRRHFLLSSANVAGLALAGALPTPAVAQKSPLRIGLMLPETGVYAEIGHQSVQGFNLRLEQLGGKIGGRPVEFVRVDDQSRPDLAESLMRRLIERDKVDLVIGSVHSGVSIVMADVARRTNTLLIVPLSGANEITDSLCAPNIWRTSFSNWQVCQPMGAVVAREGRRTAMTSPGAMPPGSRCATLLPRASAQPAEMSFRNSICPSR